MYRPSGRSLVSGPSVEPISLAEAKLHLREDGGGQDDLIEDVLIPAARRWVEDYTWRALITQTWDFTFRRFPSGREIPVPLAPLQSVTSVTYFDTDNASQTVSSSDYIVDTSEEPGSIHLLETASWPSTYTRPSAVTVRAVVGFGAAGTAVPETYLQAMRLLLGTWYENRESVLVGKVSRQLEDALKSLIGQGSLRARVG